MNLTIHNISELKQFVNRTDVSIKSAFEVTEAFLKVGDNDNDDNFSVCICITLVNGTGEPDFTKQDIINWIIDFEKNPKTCTVMFSFK